MCFISGVTESEMWTIHNTSPIKSTKSSVSSVHLQLLLSYDSSFLEWDKMRLSESRLNPVIGLIFSINTDIVGLFVNKWRTTFLNGYSTPKWKLSLVTSFVCLRKTIWDILDENRQACDCPIGCQVNCTVKAQTSMKSIIKIVHLPSVVQSDWFKATRILFVH